MPFPEPTGPPTPRADVLLGYLDYFRSLVVSKVHGLSEAQLRVSLLPSGWTVLELVKHLTHVEQRWLVCGFDGQPVARPWGDSQERGFPLRCRQMLTGAGRRRQGSSGRPTSRLGGAVRGPRGGGGGGRVRPALRSDW